ncbi:MAG TPA: AbrB family transcriptional regulator [Desulfobulbaceae bacterium]|jgi:AbrB family looped-hinge helix DNA binding protein|nr:AbrB family transcriptional regulator [Desulfobulbaceae bacterium]
MISTVTTKGQVTIPKRIRDILGINPHDKVDFIQEGKKIVLVPVRTLLDMRGAVPVKPGGDFAKERKAAKQMVAERIVDEMT